MKNSEYVAIVIAAGLSSRMGMFKPLLNLGGCPALFRLLDTFLDAGMRRIVFVTGFGRESIEEAIETYVRCDKAGTRPGPVSVETVFNADYEVGMFASIRTGIEYVMGPDGMPEVCGNIGYGPNAALLFPVDVPLVSANTIIGLIGAFEAKTKPDCFAPPCCAGDPRDDANYRLSLRAKRSNPEKYDETWIAASPAAPRNDGQGFFARTDDITDARRPFAVPVYEGKNGHPLLIPREYFPEILAYEGEGGLKGVRSRYDADMIRYETDDAGCILDMDTSEDYAKLLEYDKRHKDKE